MDFLNALDESGNILKERTPLYQIQHLKGLLFLAQGMAQQALEVFIASQQMKSNAQRGLVQVAKMASHGYFDQALELVGFLKDNVIRESSKPVKGMNYYDELLTIEQTIKDDMLYTVKDWMVCGIQILLFWCD